MRRRRKRQTETAKTTRRMAKRTRPRRERNAKSRLKRMMSLRPRSRKPMAKMAPRRRSGVDLVRARVRRLRSPRRKPRRPPLRLGSHGARAGSSHELKDTMARQGCLERPLVCSSDLKFI